MFDWRFFVMFAIIVLAKSIEAITGFGSTVIALTLGVQLYSVEFLLPVIVPLNLVLSAYIILRHHEAIDWRELLTRILPLTGAGLVVGMAVFDLVEGRELKLGYGIFVFCFAVFELARALRSMKGAGVYGPVAMWKAVIWLVAGGVMHGIYASGGPLVVYYANRKIPDKSVFRSTLSVLWLALNLLLLGNYIIDKKISTAAWYEFGALLPAVFAGIFIGDALHGRIPEKKFRILVFVLLIIAGASLALKA